jgi:hypothetical protein
MVIKPSLLHHAKGHDQYSRQSGETSTRGDPHDE